MNREVPIKIEEIKNRRLNLCIIGSGYVGLPTAALFADTGFHVVAVDVKGEIVEAINHGHGIIDEPDLDELILRNTSAGRLRATLDSKEALVWSDVVIVAVQTPVGENKRPDLSYLKKALKDVSRSLRRGMLLVLTSTVPPGTLLESLRLIAKQSGNLKADVDFYVAYAPERIAPGKALKEFVESPRLVGGIGPNSTKIAAELFRTVCKRIIETDASTAEVAKVAENTFRDVNIAFANQLALICEQREVDVTTVIELANSHPRVNIHMPGPGVGGPCLTKDPYLLIHEIEFEGHNLIKTARETNDSMPQHIVNLAVHALKLSNKSINKSRIAILGTAYKANVGDSRFSPAEQVIKKLIELGAEVIVYDPYCTMAFGAMIGKSLYEIVNNADCLIVLTDHSEFKGMKLHELRELMNNEPIIIDGKRIIDPQLAEALGFSFYGLGYGKLNKERRHQTEKLKEAKDTSLSCSINNAEIR